MSIRSMRCERRGQAILVLASVHEIVTWPKYTCIWADRDDEATAEQCNAIFSITRTSHHMKKQCSSIGWVHVAFGSLLLLLDQVGPSHILAHRLKSAISSNTQQPKSDVC